jgi:hypothetical protein
MGLERVPLSLVSTTEELLDRKVAAPLRPYGSVSLNTQHSISAKVCTNFAEKRRSLGQYSLVALGIEPGLLDL